MISSPVEPIVALDELNPTDTCALDSPLYRATQTVANAYKSDPVVTYFATPGSEKEHAIALVETMRQQNTHMVYECSSFCGVAFVLEINPAECTEMIEDNQRTFSEEQREVAKLEAISELAATADAREVSLTGMDQYTATLLGTLKPDKVPELIQYYFQHIPKLLQEYSKEVGGAPVLHIQFLASEPPSQHKGLASRLLDHITKAAHAERKHVFVEATTSKGLELCKFKGFQEWRRLAVGQGGGPEVVIMTWKPEGACKEHSGPAREGIQPETPH